MVEGGLLQHMLRACQLHTSSYAAVVLTAVFSSGISTTSWHCSCSCCCCCWLSLLCLHAVAVPQHQESLCWRMCACCMCILHVHSACACCMCMLHVHLRGPTEVEGFRAEGGREKCRSIALKSRRLEAGCLQETCGRANAFAPVWRLLSQPCMQECNGMLA